MLTILRLGARVATQRQIIARCCVLIVIAEKERSEMVPPYFMEVTHCNPIPSIQSLPWLRASRGRFLLWRTDLTDHTETVHANSLRRENLMELFGGMHFLSYICSKN